MVPGSFKVFRGLVPGPVKRGAGSDAGFGFERIFNFITIFDVKLSPCDFIISRVDINYIWKNIHRQ